jgi:ATP-binding cassette, subfamily B, bacterial
MHASKPIKKPSDNTFGLLIKRLKNYISFFVGVVILSIIANGLSLLLPSQLGAAINKAGGGLQIQDYLVLVGIVIGVVVLSIIQSVVSTYFAETVAKDLRQELMTKVTNQPYQYINQVGTNDLLTIMTSDVNNTKQVIAQGLNAVFSALLLLIGGSTLLIISNWKLALISLATLPVIVIAFGITFSIVGPLFGKVQQNTTKLNQYINETIFGAGLVRVLDSSSYEQSKFQEANLFGMKLNYTVIRTFSILFPLIGLLTQVGSLLILWLGGNEVINNSMNIGQLVTYLSYYAILTTPIFILGFTSQLISFGVVSYGRVLKVLDAPQMSDTGTYISTLSGAITIDKIEYQLAGKYILKDVSLTIQPGSRVAIVGPTAAGKTQLFNILTGLLIPTNGLVQYDGVSLANWDKGSLLKQVGLVFQDSIIFNTTVRKNIVFDTKITDDELQKVIYTSKVDEFVDTLPLGLETLVSERGGDLSGGQKQRLMLARALATNPKILLLDDFTARVDTATEKEIWSRLHTNYPDITIISITQKIEPIQDFEQIILLEEGEVIDTGTHDKLLKSSPEYQQIWQSQQIV